MKNLLFLFLPGLLVSCNNGPVKKVAPKATVVKTDTAPASKPYSGPIQDVYDPNAPDIDVQRKKLFAYFRRHRQLDTFHYQDDTYSKYWGPSMYPPYYIEAGHLFSPDKLHAIVFYSDERSAGMRIYLKKDGDWKKIYEDTTLNNGGGGYDIELKDWNSDGMPDIALNERGPTDEVQRYDLWLMAKDGASVHHIKQFDEVANPEVSKRTGHIISWYVHGAGMTRGEYRFQNDRLVDILQVSVGPSDRQSKDSSGWVHYYRNNATIKEIYCNLDKVYEYVPSHMRKQVKEYYGN